LSREMADLARQADYTWWELVNGSFDLVISWSAHFKYASPFNAIR